MKTQLKVGLELRCPLKNESDKAESLFNKYDMFNIGEKNSTADVISKTWEFPHFDLAEDARVIVNEKNEWLGYIDVWNDNAPFIQNFARLRMDPDYTGSDVELKLIKWAEEKAMTNISKAPDDAEVNISYTFYDSQKDKIQLLKDKGFSEIRYFWRMGVNLDQNLEAFEYPEGITISTFKERKNLMEIVKCDRASFEDHWGYVKSPLEDEYKEWEHWIKMEPFYDPAYWFLACYNNEVVGLSLCANGMINDKNIGYLDSVCVKKEFRKKGIASALLKHSFAEFRKAGRTKAYLHVDADSLTGAKKLYESVGMNVNQFSTKLEKIIRKGKSYRTEKV